NYGTPPLALDHGSGVRVWDVDGNEYLDFIAGIAVSSLGHSHPAIVRAVSNQVQKLAHTSNPIVHEPGVRLAEKLVDTLGMRTRAVLVEPTLGEGGVVPAAAGYLAAARQICDETGALLVADEVQSGIGRTGHWFASLAEGVRPDVVTLAKGLGGGLPIGACIGVGDAGDLFAAGDHGSTFGGNPVACAAALAVLATIADEHLLDNVKRVGEHLAHQLSAIESPLVQGIRGSGLGRAIVLNSDRAG